MPSSLETKRESRFLPGVRLDDGIKVTRDLADAARSDAMLLVVPAQAMRSVCTALSPLLRDRTPLIACAKGIEHGTHKFMTEIIAECAPKAVPAILSGPSFAADVARGLPTAVTLAAATASWRQRWRTRINSGTFRPYHSTDVRGVEIGGAAKNVLAIAVGHRDRTRPGRERAGGADHARLCRAGAFRQGVSARKSETMTGLSGLGDLILTCSSPQSRNFSCGVALGKGQTAATAHGKLAEGVFTAPVLLEMARAKNIDMPISAAVAAVLAGTAERRRGDRIAADAADQVGRMKWRTG